jgi:arabinofuranan 3-O-arabinosyltransferase
VAALLFLWTVAFASEPGRVVADTKIDLALDPVGQAARALHLWDDATTFGVLQNQAYGYLFPMAPFSLVGQWFMEPWVTQRVWWALLLSAGYLSTRRLLQALAVGSPPVRHLGALAYALSPRVVSTLGPISSEAAPALLAPAVLLPVVLACQGRIDPRRAAGWSGLAVLACGGVNATATMLAVLPTGLWLLTRSRWWRTGLAWWWGTAVVLATAWWVAPLLLLGRFSPPFLDWIESSDAVTRQVSLLDDLRGTSHWLGHLVTSGGEWWNAGYALTAQPWLVVATSIVAGAGLAGLALRGLPERRFLLLTAGVGIALLAVPHAGVLASPVSEQAQGLLDGPLAALRNVHKADPVLRLPLVAGLTHVLGLVVTAGGGAWPAPRTRRSAVLAAGRVGGVGLLMAATLATAVPGLGGNLASRGSFTAVPPAWVEAGRWLSARAGDGVALQVPASNFGEYLWGRPLDDVLRTQTTARTAVRDAVPLTPANTIRLLDALEHRLQEGDALDEGQLEVLRAAGVRFLVQRNDLDTASTGALPTAVSRQALRRTQALRLAAGFGPTLVDAYGDRVRQVEVYELSPPVAEALASLVGLDRVTRATGAAENLAQVLAPGAGADATAVLFDGDAAAGAGAVDATGPRVVTDGYRTRARAFGGVRGRDVTQTRSAADGGEVRDYLPWPELADRPVVEYDGLRHLSATTSLADDGATTGLDPAMRPFAAFDGLSTTSWVGYADQDPALDVTFTQPQRVDGLQLSLLADRARFGELLGIPTRIAVTTDTGTTHVDVAPTGRAQLLPGVSGEPTRHLRLQVVATDRGQSALVTGLAEVRVPGLAVRETLVVPDAGDEPVDRYELAAELRGFDGCLRVRDDWVCDGRVRAPEEPTGLDRSLPVPTSRRYTVTGTLRALPGTGLDALLDEGRPTVEASSRLSPAPQVRPGAVVDGDPATAWSPAPTDQQPTLAVQYASPVRVSHLRLVVRGEWLTGRETTARVTIDGRSQLATVGQSGDIDLSPVRGRTVTVRLLLGASDKEPQPALGLAVRELEVDGVPAAEQAPALVEVGCGSGPALMVGGRAVPTAVTGPRAAAYGEGQLTFRACESVGLAAPRDRVVAAAWGGFVPDHVTLSATQAPAPGSSPERTLTVEGSATGRLTALVGAGAQSILALRQNANPGWRASVEGRELPGVTVDGWRQGFVVPAGAGGRVEVEFGPDQTYRLALVGGALLALGLLVMVLPPTGARARRRVASMSRGRWDLAPVAALVLPTLLLGPWGLLVGACAWMVHRVAPRVWVPPLTALLLVAGAGVLQASVAPGAPGPSWLEGTLRVLAAAAVALAYGAPRAGDAPSPSPAAPASVR